MRRENGRLEEGGGGRLEEPGQVATEQNTLSRRTFLRAVMLGGLGLIGARVLTRQGKGAAGGSVCRHTCGDCRQRAICNLPAASLARKERRHGAK